MSFKNNLIYHSGYVMVKDLSYTTINIVKPLCLIINRLNTCIEENRGNKYLILVPTGLSKPNETCMKNYGTENYEELFDHSLITQTIMQKNLIQMAIYLYEKLVELCNVTIILRSVFHEDNKYTYKSCQTISVKIFSVFSNNNQTRLF